MFLEEKKKKPNLLQLKWSSYCVSCEEAVYPEKDLAPEETKHFRAGKGKVFPSRQKKSAVSVEGEKLYLENYSSQKCARGIESGDKSNEK